MNASFKALGCKAWSINDTEIIFNNSITIKFNEITNVRLQNTADSRLINGVIVIMANAQQYVLAFSYKQKAEGEQAYEVLQANYGSDERKNAFQAEATKEASEIVYNIKGVRGRSLKIFPDRAVINVTAGIGSFITGNVSDGEKTIYYTDCVGLQFKESGVQIGYLQFETAARTMNNSTSNFFNENSFTFDLSVTTNEKMKEVRDYVQTQIRNCKNTQGQVATSTSSAEELKKFKELLDMGIITQEEFDAKKKQLLGL